MSESDVNRILVELAGFKAEVTADLRAIRNDNLRGEAEHVDFKTRIRSLEDARTSVKGALLGYAASAVGGGGVVAVLLKVIGG